MGQSSTIPVTFDKSHLTTIGSRLYSESLDLIRELVANAYDADASTVKISTTEQGLQVEDNGSGMDREGIEQYFTIGSTFKRSHSLTPKYKRQRIGEFGIGKFAVLSLCDRFELYTWKEGKAYTIIFDQADFEQSQNWEVPVIEHQSSRITSGTKVTLFNLKQSLNLDILERKLRSQLPLNQKNFRVLLNGNQLEPRYIPGRRFRIRQSTEYGPINGEVVVSSLQLSNDQQGIAIRVKGMQVCREFFGLEQSKVIPRARLTGEISADWLPLTAARDNLLKDNPEHHAFQKSLQKPMKRIRKQLAKLRQNRRDIKADQNLSDALNKVRQALKRNKDFMLTHDLPLFNPQKEDAKAKQMQKAVGEGLQTAKLSSKKKPKEAEAGKLSGEVTRKMPKKRREQVKTVLKDKRRLIKKLKIGGVNIVCSLTHLGPDEVESFTEGGIIFINRDHRLYQQVAKNADVAAYHLARLITQELIMLTRPTSANQSYEWQSRLLTDALVEK